MLKLLRKLNLARHNEWPGSEKITPSFRGLELGGEAGEALNKVKKLERERLGIKGSRASLDELGEELADVIICADLIAMDYGIDLELAIARKFNQTSDAVGLDTKFGSSWLHGTTDVI